MEVRKDNYYEISMLFSNHYHSNEKIKVNRSSYLHMDHQFLEKKSPRLNLLGLLKFFKHYTPKIGGPEGRTRTDTSSLTADFESAASTNFTTSGEVVCVY